MEAERPPEYDEILVGTARRGDAYASYYSPNRAREILAALRGELADWGLAGRWAHERGPQAGC